MQFNDFFSKYLVPFEGMQYRYFDDKGFIVWRRGTGDNVELLHLRSFEPRKGYATMLLKEMLSELKAHPPYFSVYGFGLLGRKDAVAAYKALGFKVEEVTGPYIHGPGFLFWASYKELVARHLGES